MTERIGSPPPAGSEGGLPDTLLHTGDVTARERYQLLTSLVVPRPIAWVSTRSADGRPNLAPFSYFAAVSATPMLVSISIGSRGSRPKDTLRNIRETGDFCVNIVTEPQLAAMNQTAGEYAPDVDEFERASLFPAQGSSVQAPYVRDCPAVLECRLFREVGLGSSPNTLILGEVLLVRLAPGVPFVPGTCFADTEALRPVGRAWGDRYTLIGAMPALPRPAA